MIEKGDTMEQGASKPHLLDLKIPLGSLLTFYGVLLILYGLFGDATMYQKSQGININLLWGILTTIVGGVFLAFSFVKRKE
jgi:hypothetical protein